MLHKRVERIINKHYFWENFLLCFAVVNRGSYCSYFFNDKNIAHIQDTYLIYISLNLKQIEIYLNRVYNGVKNKENVAEESFA